MYNGKLMNTLPLPPKREDRASPKPYNVGEGSLRFDSTGNAWKTIVCTTFYQVTRHSENMSIFKPSTYLKAHCNQFGRSNLDLISKYSFRCLFAI